MKIVAFLKGNLNNCLFNLVVNGRSWHIPLIGGRTRTLTPSDLSPHQVVYLQFRPQGKL